MKSKSSTISQFVISSNKYARWPIRNEKCLVGDILKTLRPIKILNHTNVK
jgi:hypothetical protein